MHWVLNYWTYLLVELLNISFERSFNIYNFTFLFLLDVFFSRFFANVQGSMVFDVGCQAPTTRSSNFSLGSGGRSQGELAWKEIFLGSRNRCVYWLYPTPSMQSSPPGLYIIVYIFSRETPIPNETFIWRLESWVEGRSNAYSYWCVDLYSRSHAVNMPWK